MRGPRMLKSKCDQRVDLEIVCGQAHQRRRAIERPGFLIGTSCECDLVLSAAQFSEVYACLIVSPSQVSMRQVGDGPAIFINGQPASHAGLRDGDRIVAGPFEFIVHIAPPPENQLANYERPSRTATRWSAAHDGDALTMSLATKLICDIRAALNEQRPAMRRPA
jgi:hypothetical protein